jgi:hypothetical protein
VLIKCVFDRTDHFLFVKTGRFVLPLMQSYTKAGDFTVKGKLRSSLIDNAIYYGSYLIIATILLIYFEFDW